MTRIEEIAEAAERLFSAQGYHATSVRQVARAVNLQGGSLYAHFGSKEEMLDAIVSRAADEFQRAGERALATTGSNGDRLRALIAAHVEVIGRNPEAATVYFQDWRHLAPSRVEEFRARRDAYEALWRGLVADGIAAGEFRSVNPRIAAIACLSMCNWLYQWYDPRGKLSPRDVADSFAEILINGIVSSRTTSNREQLK